MGASMQAGGGRGGRGRRRRGSRQLSDINVTPMVDVMMVLLIVFMVAAPMLTVGVPLELPKTNARSLPSEQEQPLTVNLDADGLIYIQQTPVPDEELIARLTAIAAERTSKRIYMRADRTLDYGRVMQVMGALSAGGFGQVALVTDQAQPERQGN